MDRLVTGQALIRCPPDVERLCLLLCTHRSCASHTQGHGVSHACAINSYVSRYARVFAYRVNLATRQMSSISENAGHQQFGVCDHGVRVTSPTPRHADKTTRGIIGSMCQATRADYFAALPANNVEGAELCAPSACPPPGISLHSLAQSPY